MAESNPFTDGGPEEPPSERLTPSEDATLRRLHWFSAVGVALSPEQRALLQQLRARDLRTEVREPVDVLQTG